MDEEEFYEEYSEESKHGHNPYDDHEEYELDELIEAEYLQSKYNPISQSFISTVRGWSIKEFNEVMNSLFRFYEE